MNAQQKKPSKALIFLVGIFIYVFSIMIFFYVTKLIIDVVTGIKVYN
jgi:hypothetical protein